MPDRDAAFTERLAEATAQAPLSAHAETARAVLRLSLVDWAAVGLAGREEPVARSLRRLAAEEGGAAQASVIGAAARAPARMAALVNGATSHALDYDDTHFLQIGHTSVAVLPAALALAERSGASGAALIDAALIGSEVACRVGDWLGRAHYQAGFHQTATSGAIGAAAASARLLGLDAARTAHAFGVVATRASGLKSQFGTMGKPYNAGLAAANGVEAALLAADGFVSRPDGLDGPQGFGATHAGEARAAALDGFGETFVFERVSHKFHACCHGLHAMLEALRAAGPVDPEAVERVEVATHPRWLSVCDLPAPRTGLEAKFSYRLTAAMALAGRDTAALDAFSDAACADPALLALRDRVVVAADPALADTAARVVVRLADGRTAAAAHDLDAPAPLETRRARVRAKTEALLGDGAAPLWAAVESVTTAGLAPLTALLRADPRRAG